MVSGGETADQAVSFRSIVKDIMTLRSQYRGLDLHLIFHLINYAHLIEVLLFSKNIAKEKEITYY